MKFKTGENVTGLGIPGINGGRPTVAGQTLEVMVEGDKVYMVDNGEGAFVKGGLLGGEELTCLSCRISPRALGRRPPHSQGDLAPSARLHALPSLDGTGAAGGRVRRRGDGGRRWQGRQGDDCRAQAERTWTGCRRPRQDRRTEEEGDAQEGREGGLSGSGGANYAVRG